jgi:hypothetical protein
MPELTTSRTARGTGVRRRSVLAGAATGLLAGALGSVVGVAGRAEAAAARVPVLARAPRFTTGAALYRRSRFTRLRHKGFQLRKGRIRHSVVLAAVRDLPHAPAGDQTAYELVFRARSGAVPEGTYEVRRPGFRPTSLFLVPDPGGRTARAVVNRRR